MEIIRFALVLTVAAIPVALPAVLSVTIVLGAMKLAKRQAIVSRLTAIEELAGVDVFCCDKTGTLTKNEMVVADPVLLNGFKEEDLFLHAALASKAENNDPIEVPIFNYLKEKLPGVKWESYDNLAIAKEIGNILGLEQKTIRSVQLTGAASNELLKLVETLSAAFYKRLKGEVSMREGPEFCR